MKQDRKKIKKEKKRIKAIRELRDQRNKRKYNLGFTLPRTRDIRFKNPKEKK